MSVCARIEAMGWSCRQHSWPRMCAHANAMHRGLVDWLVPCVRLRGLAFCMCLCVSFVSLSLMFRVCVCVCLCVCVCTLQDVLAKCYGGDVTRKMKLLQRNREAKSKLKVRSLGTISLPASAFPELMRTR